MMNGAGRRRLAQIEVMAEPDRLSVLAVLISSPVAMTVAEVAAAPGDTDEVARHMRAMEAVGLIEADQRPVGGAARRFRPTADALARFGGAAIGNPVTPVPLVDPGDHTGLLKRISAGLAREFGDHLSAETVADLVGESYQLLAARASVRTHLPTLTERFVTERLHALVEATDVSRDRRRDVLFVCVRNAGRSQIAAALARSMAGDRVQVRTAGSVPAAQLDPVVRSELLRRGLAGWTEFPRPLTSEVVQASGVVVTMGCGDACPVVPGRRYVDWPIEDPVGRSRREVREIVDDIAGRVQHLLGELDAS